VTLKATVLADRQKYREIADAALRIGGKAQNDSFLLPKDETKTLEKALGISLGYKLLILREEDIEQGGPQPRLKIIDDQKTRDLAASIDMDGQRDPIDTYPSPLGNGKHRVCEGHRRYTAIFGILKPQGKLDFILAKEKNRTELEAWQDAWLLNDKEDLSDYEKGAYMLQLQQKFPNEYPTHEALAKKLNISRSNVTQLIQCYTEIERQTPKTNNVTRVTMEHIPEGTVRQARKAPEELKPAIYETIIENDLSSRETKQLVEAVKAEESPTEKTVEEKAALLFEETEKEGKKLGRFIDKLIEELVPYYPKELIQTVFASFSGDKVTVEKIRDRCQTLVDFWYKRALDAKTLDADLAEAKKWK
ncbi:MAG: ParB N-terminal domain-containing protein, partial [Candidatus Nanoarchaeia archaeon]|nr:ParB N-terminal domain-containing protein [Candidatus Nanoarchaeia archaeon]